MKKKIISFALLLLLINTAIAQKTKKLAWGYINTSGKMVIPLKYKEARDFSDGLAVVTNQKNELVIIDKMGNETPVKNKNYEKSYGLAFKEGLCAVEINKKYGFINNKGEEVIPCEFDLPKMPNYKDSRTVQDAPKFVNGVAVVFKNGFYGVINKTGKIIVPFEYQLITNFENKLAVVQKDISTANTKGVMDLNGNMVVKPIYEEIFIDREDIIQVHFVEGKGTNYYAFLNNNREDVYENRYTYLSKFEKGYALYGTKKEEKLYGIIDLNSNTRTPLKERYIFDTKKPWQFTYGYLFPVDSATKKRVVLNNKGERINKSCGYDYIENVQEGIACGLRMGSKKISYYDIETCTLIYETDHVVTRKDDFNFRLFEMSDFRGGYAFIKSAIKDSATGLYTYVIINKQGKITFSRKGEGGDFSSELFADFTEPGIFSFKEKSEDENKMTYDYYLKGDGTIIYKAFQGGLSFKDGLVRVRNFVE